MVPPPDRPVARWTPLTIGFGATSIVSTVLLVALAALITRQDLWPQLMNGPEDPATVPTRAPTSVLARVVPTLPAGVVPAIAHRAVAGVGEAETSGPWRFVVGQVALAPDDTASGWNQVIVTCTIENVGSVAAHLPIPSTVASEPTGPGSSQQLPNFLPAPAVAEQAPAVVGGLRLYLIDQAERSFGGGFGPSGASYEVVAAPGDLARLTYRFRYPTSARAPFILRMMFPMNTGGDVFDVHLDQTVALPTSLSVLAVAPRVAKGRRVIVAGDWAMSFEGIDFGPASSPGERPVTIHLRVENLGDGDRPALTDVSDRQGTMRDFYVTDSAGHLAYSHMDDLPGVVVPARSSRDVMVQLHTLDLASTARPLFFTAVLNWSANQFAQFQLD